MPSHVDIARRSTRGSLELFVGNVLLTAFSAVTVIIIARILGKDDYGVYTLTILLPGLLMNFLGFGVSSGITRYAAYHISRDEPEVAKRMTVNGLLFLFTFGVVLSAICYLSAGYFSALVLHRPGIAGLVRFASLYLFASCAFSSAVSALLGWSAMARISVSNVFESGLRLVATAALLLLGLGTVGAVLGYAASLFLAALLALAFLWSRMGRTTGGFPQFASDIKTMLTYGYTLFVGQLAISVMAQYVVIVLAAIASDSGVGLYQSAYNVTAAISVVSGAMTQTLFPAFAHLQGSEGDISSAFRYATKYMGLIVAPIIFFLVGTSLQLTDIVYTSAYSDAAPYLALLALSNISLLFGYGVLPSFFNGVGRPRYYMLFALVGSAVQLVLAPTLAIYAGLGIQGLIYSVLLANLSAALAGLLLASKYLDARFDLRGALATLIDCVVSCAIVLLLNTFPGGDALHLLLDAVVFVAAYLTIAPVLRAVGPEDLSRLEVATAGLGALSGLLSLVFRYERALLGLASRKPGSQG